MSAEGSAIPLDLVERLVGPMGLAQMVRVQARGVRFRPWATLFVRGRRYVAEIAYEQPVGPERESVLVVQLGVCVWRQRTADGAGAPSPGALISLGPS